VCLRFAGPVTGTVARLTTGSGGLTPGRAGFAPAGQQTKFQGDITFPPIPIDQQCLVASEIPIRYVIERMDKLWEERDSDSSFGVPLANPPSSYIPGHIRGCIFRIGTNRLQF
jgi:hypothetical protein